MPFNRITDCDTSVSERVSRVEEPRSVCDVFEAWAKRNPAHTAIICEGDKTVSYRDLYNAAALVTRSLQEHGVRPGDLVPVLATRSPEMIATFFGILKAGACYVPVDIEAWSEDRIQSTIARISPQLVVNLGPMRDLQCQTITVKKIETPSGLVSPFDSLTHTPDHQIQPNDLAYIIFTSGTTSAPKGVMIPHRALLNYVQQGTEEAPFNANATPNDITLLIFSPGFDACTGLVFSTLCNGAQIMIPSSANFLDCIPLCTILTATPSVLAAVQDPEACPNLRTIVLGGEAPPPWLIRKWWAPGRNIYNAYGPTETTICSLIGRIYPEKEITLGVAMPNSRVELYEDEKLSDQGEICISGPGLALGYFQDEGRTAKSFVFRDGVRMYRTGDFARRTSHGLEFAGRADSLVKNRGFLINLESEVIPILLKAGALTATALMYQNRLLGFVTPSNIDATALRSRLAAVHEAYLTPDSIFVMDALPLTANGKADNRAILQLYVEGKLSQGAGNQHFVEIADEPRMQLLKSSIAEATSQSVQDLSNDRSFWELGGNSLAALKVLSFLRKHGYKLPLKSLFELPNLVAVRDALQSNNSNVDLLEPTTSSSADAETGELSTAPMTTLQVKMIEASLKSPGANYLLMKIHIPHPGTELDTVSFKAAWQQVLQRHSIFRTTYLLQEETQRIQPGLNLDWTEEVTTEAELEEVILQKSDAIRRRILSGHEDAEVFVPVHSYCLITVPGQSSELLISAHHAQADGWSFAIILEEVQTVLSGRTIPETKSHFTHIARAQRTKQADAEGVSFWTDALKGFPTPPKLSLPKPPQSAISSDWNDSIEVQLDCNIAQLSDAGRRFRVMPSSLIYAAWALVLSNNSSTDNVSFGAVFSGRNLADIDGVDKVVGPLLNTVPFPISFKDLERSAISDVVSDVNDRLMQMLEHQWAAPEVMASMTGEDINGLLQSIVVTEYDLPPLPGSWSVERQDLMEFGLSLLIESYGNAGQALRSRMLFDRATYTQSAIRQLLAQFKNSLRELMALRNTIMKDVCSRLLDDEARQLLVGQRTALINGDVISSKDFNTIKDAFEAAAQKWPDSVAVECSRFGSLTYRQLDQLSNAVARWLRRSISVAKKPQNTVVGVLTDGSLNWIVAVLATFKAGCICCAIDINLPRRRMDIIAEQSGAALFLAANRNCSQAFRPVKDTQNVLIVNEYLSADPNRDAAPLETIAGTKSIVYLVFTSGSTGTPKGVPLHNTSILSVIRNPFVRLFAAPGRRNAQLFGLGFDVVLVEIFGSLCYGATLVLKDASDPFAHLRKVHATMATPSLLSACLPADYPNLDTIALAGESVPSSLVTTWASRVHLMNLYGPSECGPISTGTTLKYGEHVTIGQPLPGLCVYVLDHHKNPVAAGITGEIYISGDQTTHGYWNPSAAATNDAVFVPNPFSTTPEQKYMYRTGDLGYWDVDMNLCYVGRVDNQVKIRGHRVELEEIERAICAAPTTTVESAAVISMTESSGNTRIVAFVTPSSVSTSNLRADLMTLLPSYSRPSRIFALDALPKSANLKLDRKALVALADSAQVEQIDATRPNGVVEPLTPTEETIARIWKELLALGDAVVIHPDDDFLALGGNSIMAIRAARRITSSIGQYVPVALLIRETILGRLATAIDRRAAAQDAEGSNPNEAAEAVLTDLEIEMYQAIQESDTKQSFNTVVQLEIHGEVDIGALTDAFTTVIWHNPILRARYNTCRNGLLRSTSSSVTKPSFMSGEPSSYELRSFIAGTFDLAHDQLIQVRIHSNHSVVANPLTEVVIVTHHLITDKASLSIMLNLVGNEYRRLITQHKAANGEQAGSTTAAKRGSSQEKPVYADWAQWNRLNQSTCDSKTRDSGHVKFWAERFANLGKTPWLQEPIWRPRHDQSARLAFDVQKPGSTSHEQPSLQFSQRISVAAVALALRAVYGISDILLGLPYMNRDDALTADMLGLFVDRLPVRLLLEGEVLASANSLLDAVAEEINLAVEHYLPYRQIKSCARSNAPHDRPELITIILIYNWQTDALEKSMNLGPDLQVSAKKDGSRPEGLIFPMLIDVSEQEDGSLHIELEYSTVLFSSELVAQLAKLISANMQRLVQGLLPST
ncbi:putative non-ribosomal peptide synthetase SirP [Lepidopterella palustris CBS 459.81]|uniref:Putative non-ribosomal peptide synthetase SirP n=1 Tax=Lepidopterella palustris CBS 459.81 TaxID=1314670 RepID=A0A8E2JCF1_9PEZI|nr:putative non-ribosomal peptide synthetase SirP [Lepidopterella palustris CBS 459.81]